MAAAVVAMAGCSASSPKSATPARKPSAAAKGSCMATAPGTPVEAKEFVVTPESMHFYARYDDSKGVDILFEHSTDSDIAMCIQKVRNTILATAMRVFSSPTAVR